MRTFLILAALTTTAVAGCAPTPDTAAGNRQCFLANYVQSFSGGESRESIIINASRRESFELQAVGYCQDIDWANQVVIDPLGGGSSLCVGDQADLIVRPLGGPVERCRVRVTRQLTEAEVEAR
jgi:hypothetical protein